MFWKPIVNIWLGFKNHPEWKMQIPINKGFTQKQASRGVLSKRCSEKIQQNLQENTHAKDDLPIQSYSKNTRRRCEICSKLTTKITKRRHWHCWGVITVNFSHLFLLSILLLWACVSLADNMSEVFKVSDKSSE